MTWKQIRFVAEKRGLLCKQVYELVVAQKPATNKRKRKPCPNWKKGETCYLCECDWWKGDEFECSAKRCDLSVLGTASAVR